MIEWPSLMYISIRLWTKNKCDQVWQYYPIALSVLFNGRGVEVASGIKKG